MDTLHQTFAGKGKMLQIVHALPLTIAGSDDLYQMVRAAFVARKSSLNAWCKAAGVNRQTAEKALKGERHGRRALELRKRLIAELFSEQAA